MAESTPVLFKAVYRPGHLIIHCDKRIPFSKALFDTGALYENYISKQLVDQHRIHQLLSFVLAMVL